MIDRYSNLDTMVLPEPISWRDSLRYCSKVGWRLPTVFELHKICLSFGYTGFYWTASSAIGYAPSAWSVLLGNPSNTPEPKDKELLLCLIYLPATFDFLHGVTLDEIVEYRINGTLPDWHPPLCGIASSFKGVPRR